MNSSAWTPPTGATGCGLTGIEGNPARASVRMKVEQLVAVCDPSADRYQSQQRISDKPPLRDDTRFVRKMPYFSTRLCHFSVPDLGFGASVAVPILMGSARSKEQHQSVPFGTGACSIATGASSSIITCSADSRRDAAEEHLRPIAQGWTWITTTCWSACGASAGQPSTCRS